MSWVNLNDVYVNKTGDTIAGDLSVNGTLKVNDGKGTNTTYNVANEITALRDSVSRKARVKRYSKVTATRNWVTYESAADIAAYFGITTNMIDTNLIATACNGDLSASSAIVSVELNSRDGLSVRSSLELPTRINVSVARV